MTVLSVASWALIRLRYDGAIGDEVLHRLEYELDVEAVRIGLGERLPVADESRCRPGRTP